MPKQKSINPRTEWGEWNKLIAREADNIFSPTPKTSDMKILSKWNIKNPKTKGVKTEATQTSNKWENTIKHYAKVYEISTIGKRGSPKSVNQLSNEIYAYEVENRPKEGMYPFLHSK